MKLIAHILKLSTSEKKDRKKTFAEYQQELLVKQGREQIKSLVQRGLTIPVAYL